MVLQTTTDPLRATDAPLDSQGLTAAQAAQALRDDGPNALPGDSRRGLLGIVLETMHEPMFMLLLAAGGLYLVLGDLQEGLILFGLVLVVLALTLYQEGKTERALEALRELTSPRALVLRDGKPLRIPGHTIGETEGVTIEGRRIEMQRYAWTKKKSAGRKRAKKR